MKTNFLLGELKITELARIVLKRVPYDLVCRHAINEHGLVSKRELEKNLHGMQTLGPIVSRYKADPTNPRTRMIIITTKATWDETVIDVE